MIDTSPDETIRAALQLSQARLRRQHELVVDFSVASLKQHDLDTVLTGACTVVAEGMRSRFAKVLQPAEDGLQFRLTHGVGWDADDIGSATVGADDGSPAGYAFANNRAVLSNHLGLEDRFRTPSLLKKYGIERAINVPIRGALQTFGVLEADSGDGDDFIETDLIFMEGIANVVAMAAERSTLLSDQPLSTQGLYSESVLNASPDCVKILTPCGLVEFFNESGICQMQVDSTAQVYGKPWASFWPDDSRSLVEDAIVRAAAGESVRFEAFCPTAKGDSRWWDVTAAPIANDAGATLKVIAVSRDITERHEHEVALAALIEAQNQKLSDSDLHLAEIHHRVKNSLHLVNTLLLLQANLAADEAVKAQLQAAAGRVLTIAKVHDRLYRSAEDLAVEVEGYLAELLTDIGSTFDARQIHLHVEPLDLSIDRMAPLGLVISELVTNALKYGKGSIRVSLAPAGDHAVLRVTDEGDGFPANYPKPNGTGLGMRLVQSYSRFGNGAVTVDRGAPTSTIEVKFKL